MRSFLEEANETVLLLNKPRYNTKYKTYICQA